LLSFGQSLPTGKTKLCITSAFFVNFLMVLSSHVADCECNDQTSRVKNRVPQGPEITRSTNQAIKRSASHLVFLSCHLALTLISSCSHRHLHSHHVRRCGTRLFIQSPTGCRGSRSWESAVFELGRLLQTVPSNLLSIRRFPRHVRVGGASCQRSMICVQQSSSRTVAGLDRHIKTACQLPSPPPSSLSSLWYL